MIMKLIIRNTDLISFDWWELVNIRVNGCQFFLTQFSGMNIWYAISVNQSMMAIPYKMYKVLVDTVKKWIT